MEKSEVACHKCAKSVAVEDSVQHPVRMGYSPDHFPLLHFEKAAFCPQCHSRQKKIDRFEKVLAIIALGIVLYFLFAGYILLF